jgi:hypothetical protein
MTNANLVDDRDAVRSTLQDIVLRMDENLIPSPARDHLREYKSTYAEYHGYAFGAEAPEGAEDEIERRWDADHYGMKHLMDAGNRHINLMFRSLVNADPTQLPEEIRDMVAEYAKLDREYWARIVRNGASGPEQMR